MSKKCLGILGLCLLNSQNPHPPSLWLELMTPKKSSLHAQMWKIPSTEPDSEQRSMWLSSSHSSITHMCPRDAIWSLIERSLNLPLIAVSHVIWSGNIFNSVTIFFCIKIATTFHDFYSHFQSLWIQFLWDAGSSLPLSWNMLVLWTASRLDF